MGNMVYTRRIPHEFWRKWAIFQCTFSSHCSFHLSGFNSNFLPSALRTCVLNFFVGMKPFSLLLVRSHFLSVQCKPTHRRYNMFFLSFFVLSFLGIKVLVQAANAVGGKCIKVSKRTSICMCKVATQKAQKNKHKNIELSWRDEVTAADAAQMENGVQCTPYIIAEKCDPLECHLL